MTAKKEARKSAKSAASREKAPQAFTEEEKTAMKERSQESKAASRPRSRSEKGNEASAVLAKLAAMPEPDRVLGEKLHAIIQASAPTLAPKLWYGMPAYAKDGKVICFFQSAQKFKTRYATLGFLQDAHLDEGSMWPTAFALKALTATEEAAIISLVKKAVS